MQLVQARDNPWGQPAPAVFDADESAILEAVCATLEGKTQRQKCPHPKASLAWPAWVIGRLGGWNGYYSKPGPRSMSRGLQAFRQITIGAQLFQK